MKISHINLVFLITILLVLPIIIGQDLTLDQKNNLLSDMTSENDRNIELGKLAKRPEITFKGFKGLKFNSDGKTVTDGKGSTSVDLENLPEDISEIEYEEGKFIYKFKSGGEISVAKG